ncbi:MAG: YfiR family protein [Verrucomicrobiota bacterium]
MEIGSVFQLQLGKLFLFVFFALNLSAHAQTAEYKLKAVYLYNFLQYVDWPPDAFANEQSPLIIGVLGVDPFGKFLEETVMGETVKHRRIEVRRYKSVREIRNVHVLFVSASEEDKLNSILEDLKGRSILSVSDAQDFAGRGGIIRFITENNKIRFKINLDTARAANLSISSKLLQLAEIVSTEKQ